MPIFDGISHFSTDFAQIFTSILTFDTDHKTVFKIGNFVSVSRLLFTPIAQKLEITHFSTDMRNPSFSPKKIKF